MSVVTKRKYVTREVEENYDVPEPPQSIVKVVAPKGNNLHLVENAQGDNFLVSMPVKFRKNVWIKRGDYVVVEPIEEGVKVKAEIVNILLRDQIKYIMNEGKWPDAFTLSQDERITGVDYASDEIISNPNHIDLSSSEESESSEESDKSEENENSHEREKREEKEKSEGDEEKTI